MSAKRRIGALAGKAAAVAVAAGMLVGLGASGAQAAVYKSYGEETCPRGYKVLVRVELDSVGDVIYRRSGSNSTEYLSKRGITHVYYYEPVPSGYPVKWSVEGSKGIRTVSDGCYNPNTARTPAS